MQMFFGIFIAFVCLVAIYRLFNQNSPRVDTNKSLRTKDVVSTDSNIKVIIVNDSQINISLNIDDSITKIPYFLIFDTETTGIPPNNMRNVTHRNCMNYPRIVQISWVLLDRSFLMVDSSEYIIKISDPTLSNSTRIHGITQSMSDRKGLPIEFVLDKFLKDVQKVKVLASHNYEFHSNMVYSEFMRLNRFDYDAMLEAFTFCTMEQGRDFCKIYSSSYGYKAPRLSELVLHCFFNGDMRIPFNSKNNAKSDALWSAKCMQRLIQDKFLDIDGMVRRHKQWYNNLHNKNN